MWVKGQERGAYVSFDISCLIVEGLSKCGIYLQVCLYLEVKL